MDSISSSLLQRLRQAAQPEAWDRFVHLYTPLLLTWARRQGFQEADAEDLVQEVLVKLIRLLPTYQRVEKASFRGWLFKVCSNQCQDFRRRKTTRALPGAGGLSDVPADSPVTELDEIEYRGRLIRRGLELIRPDFQETTWAAFSGVMIDGRSVDEVAARLSLSPSAVNSARHRVLSRLREELDGLLD